MLLSVINPPYTVEMLTEIVASQLACFGDQVLVSRPEPHSGSQPIELEVNGEVLIKCGTDRFMTDNGVTLSYLLKRLNSLNEKNIIDTFYDLPDPWQLGFYDGSDGFLGFVEVLSVNDLPCGAG